VCCTPNRHTARESVAPPAGRLSAPTRAHTGARRATHLVLRAHESAQAQHRDPQLLACGLYLWGAGGGRERLLARSQRDFSPRSSSFVGGLRGFTVKLEQGGNEGRQQTALSLGGRRRVEEAGARAARDGSGADTPASPFPPRARAHSRAINPPPPAPPQAPQPDPPRTRPPPPPPHQKTAPAAPRAVPALALCKCLRRRRARASPGRPTQ
jgi:hypothetical protein